VTETALTGAVWHGAGERGIGTKRRLSDYSPYTTVVYLVCPFPRVARPRFARCCSEVAGILAGNNAETGRAR